MEVRSLVRLSLGALLVAVIGGCSPKPPPPASTPVKETQARRPSRPASQSLALGDDLARLCKISVDNAESAPKFDFDRSELSKEDRDVLGQVAKCLTLGPLKGRALRVVGRADPRGESEYNMGLGDHRAGSVRIYLTQLGVDASKIAETSRGELDATGKDEQGWRRDRRVDVLLQ
jgi:peptidoglycan-associated lipoprotein